MGVTTFNLALLLVVLVATSQGAAPSAEHSMSEGSLNHASIGELETRIENEIEKNSATEIPRGHYIERMDEISDEGLPKIGADQESPQSPRSQDLKQESSEEPPQDVNENQSLEVDGEMNTQEGFVWRNGAWSCNVNSLNRGACLGQVFPPPSAGIKSTHRRLLQATKAAANVVAETENAISGTRGSHLSSSKANSECHPQSPTDRKGHWTNETADSPCSMRQHCCPHQGWFCTSKRPKRIMLPEIENEEECFTAVKNTHVTCLSTIPTEAHFKGASKTYRTCQERTNGRGKSVEKCIVSAWSRWSRCESSDESSDDLKQYRYRFVEGVQKEMQLPCAQWHKPKEIRDCMSCHVVAPVPPSMSSKLANCSASKLENTADRGGCTSWNTFKCNETGANCQEKAVERCLSCHKADIMVPISTIQHQGFMDVPVGLCYGMPDWNNRTKDATNLVQITYGHSVRVTQVEKPLPMDKSLKKHGRGSGNYLGGVMSQQQKHHKKDKKEHKHKKQNKRNRSSSSSLGEIINQDELTGRRGAPMMTAQRMVQMSLAGNCKQATQAGNQEEFEAEEFEADDLLEADEELETDLGEEELTGLTGSSDCISTSIAKDGTVTKVKLSVEINERDARTRPFTTVEFREFSTVQQVTLPKPGCTPKKPPKVQENMVSVVSAKETGPAQLDSGEKKRKGKRMKKEKKTNGRDKHLILTPNCQEQNTFTLAIQVIKVSACIPKDALGLIKACSSSRKVINCYKKDGSFPKGSPGLTTLLKDPNAKVKCGLFHQGLLTTA